MSGSLKVVRPGLFDTVQDLGRVSFMALGMPTAGAMDRVALSLANALCGNPASTAGLEISVMGPDLLVEADGVRVALVGPLSPALTDGPEAPPKRLESDRTHLLKRGRGQEARLQRAIADFKVARPPGGIDLVRLYEENLIDGVVY
jgi:allophanate hydrolase subunit 2